MAAAAAAGRSLRGSLTGAARGGAAAPLAGAGGCRGAGGAGRARAPPAPPRAWRLASAAAASSGSSPSPWVGAVRRSGEAALAALRAEHGLELELFSFDAVEAEGRLAIALDKPENPYGSPSLDDIALFSQVLRARLELTLGSELADRVEVEVSSPGADRRLRLPGDLRRFGGLPLLVKYRGEGEWEEGVKRKGLFSTW